MFQIANMNYKKINKFKFIAIFFFCFMHIKAWKMFPLSIFYWHNFDQIGFPGM